MNDFKPLMNIEGKPAIINLVSKISNSRISEIIVVTGHNHNLIEDVIEEYKSNHTQNNIKLLTIYNSEYEQGMFTSIKCGFQALSKYTAAALLFPVDAPLVSVDTIETLIENWETNARIESNPNTFFVPSYRGKKGHPLLIPSNYFKEILNHDGTGGLKAITQKYPEKIKLIETNEEAVVIDMDTQRDYSYALKKGEKKSDEDGIDIGPIKIASKNIDRNTSPQIVLVRHGSIVQHKGKIFLGQTDIPLSELGKEEAKSAAHKLSNLSLNSPIIWSSPLSRAKETAEIIAKGINDNPISFFNHTDYTSSFSAHDASTSTDIILSEALSEISLGSWDGKYIEEIKKSFPDEYNSRGKDILRYKKGNASENFYDLRYRVIRTVEEILIENAKERDLIIVSHAGPIRMIISEAIGLSLEEALKIQIPKAIPLQINGQLW